MKQNSDYPAVSRRFLSPLILVALLSLLMPNRIVAQSGSSKNLVVAGKVCDADTGEAIVGAQVYIKATQVGAITDAQGEYLLATSDSKGIMVVSFLGYNTQEVAINGRTRIDFELKVSSEIVDEVVVVGYGRQKKVSVTGSMTVIEPGQLQKTSTPMLSNTLGGIMPGIISRQSSGEPGYDYAQLLIRGASTWGATSPLVLIDGIERDLNIISASDIESFSILKDASATAVYGIKGANGVILINTKKGEKGKPKITLRTEFANLHGMRFPDYINGYEFASLMNEATLQGGGTILPWTDNQLERFRLGDDPYLYPNVNWTDEVLKKNAFQSITNLSVSGGNDIVRYYINAGYTTQSGLFKEDPQYAYRTNSLSSRYNFRTNIDVNLSKNFSVELGLSEIVEDRTYPGTTSGDIFKALKITSPIVYPVYNPDGSFGSNATSYLINNPYVLVTNNGYSKQFRSTTQGTLGAKWDLSQLVTEGLSVQGRFSYDHYYFNEVSRRKGTLRKQYIGIDPETGEDRYNTIGDETAMSYAMSQNSNRAYYYEASLHYNRSFGRHNVGAMMLFNRRDYKLLTAGNSTANLPYRRQGLAGRITYDFDHRYLLEVNAGYNGSENFPKGQRYGFFPAVSAGWVISNEKFWGVNFINHLKLRGSYGLVGNDYVGGDRFLYLSTVNATANGYCFGQSQVRYNGMAELKIGSPNVSWEISTKRDVGIDMEMFNGMVSMQVDGFYETRDNILLQRAQIPDIMGATWGNTPYANLGVVNNWGGDAQIELKKTTSSGLFFSLRANATFARNRIVEDDTAKPMYDYQATRGTRLGQPFGLIAEGFFQSEEEIASSPVQTYQSVVRVGDIKYKDVNGDDVINDYDRVAIGYARTPEWMFGFGGSFAYKGFDLSFNFTGATNTSTFLDSEGMYPFQLAYPSYNVIREYYDNRFVVGQDNTDAKYPAVINGTSTNNYRTSTLYLRDASYIKLKNAEIGYTFDKRVTGRIGMDNLRIFVNGINLLCFDHLKVIDPESNYGTGGYPTQRTVNLGVQANF